MIPRGAVAARDGRVVWTGPEAEIAAALEVPDDALRRRRRGRRRGARLRRRPHAPRRGRASGRPSTAPASAAPPTWRSRRPAAASTARCARRGRRRRSSSPPWPRAASTPSCGTARRRSRPRPATGSRSRTSASSWPPPRSRTRCAACTPSSRRTSRPRSTPAATTSTSTSCCDEILPALAGQAEFVDVFCDEGAFTVAQSRRVLEAGRALGYRLKIHAEELAHTGGTALAASLGAVSADHLIHITGEDIAALAQSGTVAVLLPGTSYTLHTTYAPAQGAAGRRRHRRARHRLQPRQLLQREPADGHLARLPGGPADAGRGPPRRHHGRRGRARPPARGRQPRAGQALRPARPRLRDRTRSCPTTGASTS